MGQYELLQYLRENRGKRYTIKELQKEFQINNIALLKQVRGLKKARMIKTEKVRVRNGKNSFTMLQVWL